MNGSHGWGKSSLSYAASPSKRQYICCFLSKDRELGRVGFVRETVEALEPTGAERIWQVTSDWLTLQFFWSPDSAFPREAIVPART